MDDTIGELSSTGNENIINHFKCILSRSLPSVPSIAFDQQHKPFSILVFLCTSDEVMPRSQEETNQEHPTLTNTPNS